MSSPPLSQVIEGANPVAHFLAAFRELAALQPGARAPRVATAASQETGRRVRQCARENGECECVGEVRYGHGEAPLSEAATETWSKPRMVRGVVACTNRVFGDPAPGRAKRCLCRGRPAQ